MQKWIPALFTFARPAHSLPTAPVQRRSGRTRRSAALVLTAIGALASSMLVAAPASAAPTDDLDTALRRDLGISRAEFEARADAGERAAELEAELAGDPGFESVQLRGQRITVHGSGAGVQRAAAARQATVQAPDAGAKAAGDADDLVAGYLDQVGDRGLTAVLNTGTSLEFKVVDPAAPGNGRVGRSPDEFAAQHPGVVVSKGKPATPRVDVDAGSGITTRIGGQGFYCSLGYGGYTGNGAPVGFSAGHCTDDQNSGTAWLNRPELGSPIVTSERIGDLSFAQFGGPRNTAGSQAVPGTDMSVWGNPGVNFTGRMKTWGGNPIPLTGEAKPVIGASICQSGRTSGFHCGTITSIAAFLVGAEPNRWVNGFGAKMKSLGGDSGGSMVMGGKAVGILSAGDDEGENSTTYGANFDELHRRGYSLEFELPTPRLPAAGSTTGTVPGEYPEGTQVETDFDGRFGRVNVGGGGAFTFAPGATLYATATTVQGFNRSAPVTRAIDPRLGQPTGVRICGLKEGGCFQHFGNGSVYFTPAIGARPIFGRIRADWSAKGWENGRLGYPTSDEMCGLTGGGCWQLFQGGREYWSPATDAHPVWWGSIGDLWNAKGYEGGELGYPAADERCGFVRGGCFQDFQRGSIYWSPQTGAHFTRGSIRARWGSLGWENGRLGYPATDEYCDLIDAGCFQHFQDGSIYASRSGGTQPVWGAIKDYWASQGWERSRFGYPAEPEQCRQLAEWTCTQRFTRGTITWTPSRGARG